MIPRLEAEESIRRAQEIAVGTGALSNAREIFARWERLAAPTAAAPARRRPKMFSDEVLARLPVRRVTTRKG
jgi:hypothetical protein